MINLIINQKNNTFEKFHSAEAFHAADYEHEQNTPDYDGKFAQYRITLSINDSGDVLMTDTGIDDLMEGQVIGHVKAGLTEFQKGVIIERLENDLTVVFPADGSSSFEICLPKEKPKKDIGFDLVM